MGFDGVGWGMARVGVFVVMSLIAFIGRGVL